jgi:hypothetical protein
MNILSGDASGSVNVGADVSGALEAAAGLSGGLSAAASASGGLSASAGVSGALEAAAGLSGGLSAAAGAGIAGSLAGAASGGFGFHAGVDAGGALHADVDILASTFGGGSSAREQVTSDKDKKLAKLQIYNTDVSSSDPWLTCLFNPAQFTLAKRQPWQEQHWPGYPLSYFSGGPAAETIHFSQLWFDTYLIQNPDESSNRDVRYYTDKLLSLLKLSTAYKRLQQTPSGGGASSGSPSRRPPAPTKGSSTPTAQSQYFGRPALCLLQWGRQISWEGALTNLSIQFTLFDRDGTPVRAIVDATFQQVFDNQPPRQNPTSGGDPLRAAYLVMPGDTLESISYQQYGDPTAWRRLAAANGLEDPLALRPGLRLRIP